MSYCFNPDCLHSHQENNDDEFCKYCGANLIIQQRYRGVSLLGKSQLALTVEVKDGKFPQTNKVLKILLTSYPKAVELFQQEAKILQQINHSGIPQVQPEGYFVTQVRWSTKPLYCLVMEKIEGLNLEQWLQQQSQQPITNEQAFDWLKQLLEILTLLHQKQYFHRDIKPANIILQPDGKLALIDFGAARRVTATYLGKIGVNQGITSIGTPGYMAPEQIDGSALPQSDFFALGRTLVHLLTGKHPQELPKNLQTGELLWHQAAPVVSESLADLLDSLMHHLPGKRPANTQVILAALTKAQKSKNNFLKKWQKRLRLNVPVSLSLIVLPLSIFGVFNFGNNLNQRITTNKIQNAPLCNNLTCLNRDPIDNNCDNDAKTITSNIGNYQLAYEQLVAYKVELRYSERCHATWARSEAPYRSVHYVEDRQGNIYGQITVAKDGWNRHYADMGPGKNTEIRACAKPPTGETRCTNFVKL
ncbi:serine/threonine protein kinase [Stanieria cyanosphaera PCC 7437]|uniref:non-specific serine/threonine protein kinase n=1 Tax=Stanieria cyanosphaera (strain ATCC 29371 / PCC 7437) TaxID=111780 RepID=K9XP66_STAC7|nr:protein kinase [Stanieria cyanosphaera]AFZ34323.1 serine/threonine protein kinase [Stanieria cyanosphaera PCC 7437]